MTCAECYRPVIARGLCTMHYQRWKRRNPERMRSTGYGLDPVTRVLSRADDINGCWVYQWSTDAKGYARVRVGDRKEFAHRVTWEHFFGPIPDGLTFDHLCKNPSCVNPWHGDIVPVSVNSARNSNADKTRCPEGHPLSGDNLRFASNGKGRVCRQCRAESSRAYRLRKKASA